MGKRRKLSSHKAQGSGGSAKPKQQKQAQQQQPQQATGGNVQKLLTTKGGAKPQQQQQQQHQQKDGAPTIPFAPEDKILLVGEGDLSFAASLMDDPHYCADVTATVFEKNAEELAEKYPHVADNIAKIEADDGANGRVLYGVDATKMGPFHFTTLEERENNKTAAGKGERERSRSGATGGVLFDRILFNFPHVGGKSTDVNRQVRYNQEMLVAFFERALPCLRPGGGPGSASIVVTLFEGEPYTLWNIRDLGRHAGLQVERSFRFQASAYPGYHHARTLGVVRNKSGEVGGGWKGEDRPARSYVFVRKDVPREESPPGGKSVAQQRKDKKRSRDRDDDSSDDE